MTNYVLAYRGGDGMAAFGSSRTVHPDGSATDGGAAALAGYSIVSAADLAAASAIAKGCPLLGHGGTVEVYETIPM